MSDERDDEWPGESYDMPKNELAEPTGAPGSVQGGVSDASDASELEGEKNELAPVTDAARSVQQVVEESGDEGDGE